MYELEFTIKINDYEFLMRLQDDLRLERANLDYAIEEIYRAIRDTMAGYAAPPPESRRSKYFGDATMDRHSTMNREERYAMMLKLRELKNEIPELCEKKEKPFIDEEEMKL